MVAVQQNHFASSIFFSTLYRYGPCRPRARWRWITPGSLVAAVAWIAMSLLFSWYVATFGHYNKTYGSLGAIVGFLTWMWLSLMVLLFRNYFSSLPIELFNAARVDGAGFYRILWHVILPMSAPIIIVATILQVTGIWNDFILGLTFAGRNNRPMTVLLNNIVNSTQGEAAYNVDMAATILTSVVPLAVYFISGRWFVRGIATGAVKG